MSCSGGSEAPLKEVKKRESVTVPAIPQNCHCDDKHCYCPKKPKPALSSGAEAKAESKPGQPVIVYGKIPETSPGVEEMGECPAAYYSTACAISHFKEVRESHVPDDWRQLESQVCVHDEGGVVCYDDDPAIPKNCHCDEAQCYCPEFTKGLTCKAPKGPELLGTACAVYERGITEHGFTEYGWTPYEAAGVSYLSAERGDLIPTVCVCEQEQCKCPSLVSVPSPTIAQLCATAAGGKQGCLSAQIKGTRICDFNHGWTLGSTCVARADFIPDPCISALPSDCGQGKYTFCEPRQGVCVVQENLCKKQEEKYFWAEPCRAITIDDEHVCRFTSWLTYNECESLIDPSSR